MGNEFEMEKMVACMGSSSTKYLSGTN